MSSTSTIAPTRALFALALTCHALTCAAAEQEQKAQAILVPKESAVSAVTQVDRKRIWSLAGRPVNIDPGNHVVEVYTCESGALGRGACPPARKYPLHYEAGKVYAFMGPDLVKVYEGDMSGEPVDEMRLYGDRWLNRRELAEVKEQEARRAREQREAILAQRRSDLPRTRKVGAKLCQRAQGRVTKVAYVEGLAPEKVQLRVAQASAATTHAEIDVNSPQVVVWDTPLNWDLCE